MEKWNNSYTLFDEDDLENFLWDIKKKVQEAWEAGYQPDVESSMIFFKDN